MRLVREGHSFSGRERNCAFLNCGGERFADVSAVSGIDFADDGRGLAVTDWDQDGDVDVWLANRTGPRLRLLRNETIRSPRAESPSGQSVAFRLQGTSSNRDAIGARVEVRLRDASAGRLIQTLHAGDAFLSQSSKWLHFGLGRAPEIEEVLVRWPKGELERFAEVRPGERYLLVEGSERAVQVTAARAASKLRPASQPKMAASQTGRLLLSSRLPLPVLRYQSLDEASTNTVNSHQSPLLLTFWASWCETCVAELTAIEASAADLREAGVDCLALCVDGLDRNQTTGPQDARQLLERLRFSFAAGVATPQTLDKLQLVLRIVRNRELPFSVPLSLLVDADGSLAAVYQGQLSVRSLLEDVATLDTSPSERRNLVAPLSGSWSSPHRLVNAEAVGRYFQRRGYTEDYVLYLNAHLRFIARRREAGSIEEPRTDWGKQYANTNVSLASAYTSQGLHAEARQCLQSAVRADPDHLTARVNLGALLAKDKQLDAAIETLQRAVQIDANSGAARMNLGAALGASGRVDEAIEQFRQVLQRQPNTAPARSQLARWLIEGQEFSEAAKQLELALQLNAQDGRSMLQLAWLRATCPVESVRDPKQAVALAKRLNAASGGADATVLDVLATATAAQGDFPAAAKLADQALGRLTAAQQAQRSAIVQRQQRFKDRQPYVDRDGMYP